MKISGMRCSAPREALVQAKTMLKYIDGDAVGDGDGDAIGDAPQTLAVLSTLPVTSAHRSATRCPRGAQRSVSRTKYI